MHLALKTSLCLSLCCLTLPCAGSDWPHWRGPSRDGKVTAPSGWDAGAWPPGAALWRRNVGVGSTSPIVAGGRVYTMGWQGNRDTVFCLDAATGKVMWRQSYACPKYGRHAVGDQGLYRGPTSTPEYDAETGYLYTLSTDGHLNCWDTKRRGARVWGLNLYDTFRIGPRPAVPGSGKHGRRDYGYTTAPLVRGEWLIVEVGSRDGNLMAFDKRTGKRVWASESKDYAGHTGGPAPMVVEGVPCVAVLTHSNLLVARLDRGNEGKTVAEYPWATRFANSIASPAVHGNSVLITSGYNHKAMCRLDVTLRGARKVWEVAPHSKVCTPIIHKDRIYWAWRKIYCLDFATGREIWSGPGRGDPGSCILTADERLIAWVNYGDLILAETAERSPGAYKELSRKRRVFRTHAWPHVALAGGRLYCKDRAGNLACFRLSRAGK